MEPVPDSWLKRRATAVKNWCRRQALRGVFRYKARHLRVERGLVYNRANEQDLKLDLILPRTGGPFPLLITIPGGGWEWIAQPDSMLILDEMLADHGFAAAEVIYRLAPRDRFPAQLEDCKAAIRWLRANAARFNIDPQRVGALGFSSGAQLACLLGVTRPEDGMEGTGSSGQSSRIDAVVSYFGPTDFTEKVWRDRYEGRLLRNIIGAPFAERPDLYEKASPVHYVRPGAPPFLFLHGTEDSIVPIEHSRLLEAKLQAAGASARLIEVPGQGHGAWPQRIFQPKLAEAVKFLQETLKVPARSGGAADLGARRQA